MSKLTKKEKEGGNLASEPHFGHVFQAENN